MTLETWIQLFTPAISVVLAIIPAVFAYYFSKKKQILSDESRLKEKFYLTYIEAVSTVVVTNSSDRARDHLADAQNQLLLVGSAEVVHNLMVFHNYIKPSNEENFNANIHDELLTALIKSMRSDLYRTKKVNESYPLIHLTGRTIRK